MDSVILDSEKVCKSEVAMKRKSESKSCYEIQHSIKAYLLEEMSLDEADEFVKHIRSCKECRSELEEYYAFSSALMQLETLDDSERGNFFMNIEKRLERTELAVARERADYKKRRITYIMIALIVAAAMSITIAG